MDRVSLICLCSLFQSFPAHSLPTMQVASRSETGDWKNGLTDMQVEGFIKKAENEVKVVDKDIDEAFDSRQYMKITDLNERIKVVSSKVGLKAAAQYLESFGYLSGNRSGLTGSRLAMYMGPALVKFQRDTGINQTGVLDDETKLQMAAPRCQFPDYNTTEVRLRSKRFALGGSKWDLSTDMPLTVRFNSYTDRMSKNDQELAFSEAMDSWAAVSGLSLSMTSRSDSKITVDFVSMDGPWGTLGKAWFPKAGKIQFEYGESWVPKYGLKEDNRGELAFRAVGMHELGHALGLAHSANRNSVMYPQYQASIQELTADDIAAIQQLYGKPGRNVAPLPKPVPRQSPPSPRTPVAPVRRPPVTQPTTKPARRKTTTMKPLHNSRKRTTTTPIRKVAKTTAKPNKQNRLGRKKKAQNGR